MARLVAFEVENYRSIEGPLTITFPEKKPVILVGENNAGKSNIVKGLNLLLGTFWPGNHDPDDHEFYQRARSKRINLTAHFDPADRLGRYEQVKWEFDPVEREPRFRGYPGKYGGFDGFISNDDRDSCVCVVLEAERNLNYQLSYTSKSTLLSKLMHKFHGALLERSRTRGELEQLFREIRKKFQEI